MNERSQQRESSRRAVGEANRRFQFGLSRGVSLESTRAAFTPEGGAEVLAEIVVKDGAVQIRAPKQEAAPTEAKGI